MADSACDSPRLSSTALGSASIRLSFREITPELLRNPETLGEFLHGASEPYPKRFRVFVFRALTRRYDRRRPPLAWFNIPARFFFAAGAQADSGSGAGAALLDLAARGTASGEFGIPARASKAADGWGR